MEDEVMVKDPSSIGKSPMAVEDQLTAEDVIARVDQYNAAVKPYEDDFMRSVQHLHEVVGYGRMIQLIQQEWSRAHKEKYGFELGPDFFKGG